MSSKARKVLVLGLVLGFGALLSILRDEVRGNGPPNRSSQTADRDNGGGPRTLQDVVATRVEVSVHVQGPEGSIQHAEVSAQLAESEVRRSSDNPVLARHRSDENGNASLSVPGDRGLFISGSAAGFLPNGVFLPPLSRVRAVVIVLEKSREIGIAVRDDHGNPVQGALVALLPHASDSIAWSIGARAHVQQERRTSETDEFGMARLPIARVEPDWTVVASHELSRRIGFARLGDLSEPRVITIRPSGGLTVTVQGPNSAVGGADVTLYLAGDPVTTVEADSSGVARLLVPGDPRIHAWVGVAAPGFVSRTIYEIPRTGSLLARLTPAGAMSVVVQTADSAAVAGARLELRPNDTTISQPVARGETDTEGRGYLCFGLPEGMRASSYWLSASAEGFADTALRLEGRTLPTDPLKVTLHRSRTVDVHVVDSRNLGVPYATVFALELRGADGRRTLFAPHNLLRNPLQTDESGHITLTHLSSASALGVYAYDREAGFGHVELVPARSKCNTTVVLARHADVLVQVLSAADGARIEDAVVELWKTSGIPSLVARQVQSASSVFSNSDGWATISGLPVDASALSVRDRFGRMIPRLVQLRADVLEYQVRLRPFARVDGLVHAAESLPRPLTIRAQLMGRPDPDRFNELHEGVTSREVMIFQGNTFALDKLLPNREYCISVVGLSDAASGRGMMITRAPATRVPLYLGETAWAPVRVKINGLTGPAIVSMDIWGKGRDGDPIRLHQDRVLNHSHVVDFQLPPGRNWVRIVSIHAFPHVQWLDVPPDGTSIDVELQEQETIVTKVIDAEGQPVRNATVTLEGRPRLPGPDGRLIPCGATQATTDATGQAVLPLPPSRQWALEVRRGTSKMVGRTEGKGVPNAPIVVVLDIDKPR